MGELILVRHGQASLGASNYDQLSELGYQQAKWLGEYLAQKDKPIDLIVTGTMSRHLQTAEQIQQQLPRCDSLTIEGFNEFDFGQIITAYLTAKPDTVIPPDDMRALFNLLRAAMVDWSQNKLDPQLLNESWADFSARVQQAMAQLMQLSARRILVASSGGAIAMALQSVMQFPDATVIDTNLHMKNTGFSQLHFSDGRISVGAFNQIPHLDTAQRRHAITFA